MFSQEESNGDSPAAISSKLSVPQLVRYSIDRLREELKTMETASAVFWARAEGLGQGDPDYLFLNPFSTPAFLFPLWVERSISPTQDMAFQYELAYAATALYFYVRILDDAMDGHVESGPLLPLLTSLYAHCNRALQNLFPHGDPFWAYFYRLIDLSTDAMIVDFSAANLTSEDFLQLAAQKSYCVLIPMTAVLCKYKRYDQFERWSELWHAFSAWNQMGDDVRDWYSDRKSNLCTYVLSQAQRLKRKDESVEQWMLQDGYRWSFGVLNQFAKRARELAAELNVPEMEEELGARYDQLSQHLAHLCETLSRIDHGMGRVLNGRAG
ncbi:MAG: class 1 isoprenoid biosynthesis enzyme [Silvibacterium sp.]